MQVNNNQLGFSKNSLVRTFSGPKNSIGRVEEGVRELMRGRKDVFVKPLASPTKPNQSILLVAKGDAAKHLAANQEAMYPSSQQSARFEGMRNTTRKILDFINNKDVIEPEVPKRRTMWDLVF